MTEYPAEYYLDIVTKRYFHGVDTKNMEMVLDCFAEDAFVQEVTSDTTHRGRDTGIRRMFETLFSNFGRNWHGNFVHTTDAVAGSICSQFSVEITPAGGGALRRYENCNRFYLQHGKFTQVFVYMSGPNLLV